EASLTLVNAESDVIRNHIRSPNRPLELAFVHRDRRRQVEIRDVGLLANRIGIDEGEGVLDSVDLQIELPGLGIEVELNEIVVGVGDTDYFVQPIEIDPDLATVRVVGFERID